MRVLELISGGWKKQYLIGTAKEFQTMEPNLERIIDPNLKGCIDYCSYNKNTYGENVGIPVIVPITYDLGDISYSPTLTIEERKNKIVDYYIALDSATQVVKWEEI